MSKRSDRQAGNPEDYDALRLKIIGLGERSFRKSYYPRLQQQLQELKHAEEQLKQLSRRNELILKSAGEGIFGLDLKGNYTFLNDAAAAMLGYKVEELIGRHGHPLIHCRRANGAPYPEEECKTYAAFRDGITRHVDDEVFLKKDGASFPVEYTSTPIFEDGEIQGAVVTFKDITERKKAEQRLKESERKFKDLTERSLVGVYLIQEGVFKYINPRFAEIFAYSAEELSNRSYADLVLPEDRTFIDDCIRKRLEGKEEYGHYAFRGIRKNGDVIHVEVFSSQTVYKGNPAVIGTLPDITERKRMEEEMHHMAHHDSLTGLPNRRLFVDIIGLESAQARRHRSRMALLFMDLDRFKEVNDTLGHEVGDMLLKEAAVRLRATVRESDTISRIGGDEFNIILADVRREEDISDVARKIVETFRIPFSIAGHELHITTSIGIGISIYPDDSDDRDTLFRYADIAMYYAKEQGRNTFQFYNPAINVRSLERMQLERMLRRTIERGQLSVYYQPQMDIRSRKMVCAEALVRWNHPGLGVLEPKRFIPAAEDTGFITAIDEWVLRTACAQVKTWLDERLPSVCVIDDFGTGYSSLNYLKRLPIEKLKIDRSFIQDIATDPDDRAIISAVTAMAHTMKMKVIAEGVETEEQLAFLHETHCDEAQGYLFSKPLPAEEFVELLAQ